MAICDSCHLERDSTRSAVLNGRHYPHICRVCLFGSNDQLSSGHQGFDRRRQYEDHAQDTVQPYDAKGANPEFLRLYPDTAKKMFSQSQIDDMKRKL